MLAPLPDIPPSWSGADQDFITFNSPGLRTTACSSRSPASMFLTCQTVENSECQAGPQLILMQWFFSHMLTNSTPLDGKAQGR